MLRKNNSSDTQQIGKILTVLAKDVEIQGNFSAKEAARVDGVIKGDVNIGSELVLGATGHIIGNVFAASILVGGQIEGDLSAKEKIVISSTGKVNGNLTTKKLIVDENAVFRGNCIMGDEPPKAAPEQIAATQPAAKPQGAAQPAKAHSASVAAQQSARL